MLVGDVAGDGPGVELPRELKGRTFIANFEGVTSNVANSHRPAQKCGPHLVTEHVALGAAQIWTLANNHAADWGPDALLELRDDLVRLGGMTTGAGRTADEARTPLIIRAPMGSTLGIISVCERQYGGALMDQPGTCEVGSWMYATIRQLQAHVDFVVASIHAGPENSPWPSPQQQDQYRSFIDAGANLVHGHHPHVPQGFETYNGGEIFYGLGNFLVESDQWKGRFMSFVSLAILLDEDITRTERFKVTPIVVEQRNERVSRRIEIATAQHAAYLSAACLPLSDRRLLESLYQEVAVRLFRDHLYGYTQTRPVSHRRAWHRFRNVAKTLYQRFTPSRVSKKYRLQHHAASCPTHAQAVECATGVLSGATADLRTTETRDLTDRWARSIPSR